jgi:hypothetical protein
MSFNFSTGRFLIFFCISEIFILTLVTTTVSAIALGVEKKNSFRPNPTRIADTTAMA